MAPKLLEPEKVKPLFDLSEQHPFLLRELTGYEKSIVNHWRTFYREKIYGRGEPASQYRDEFIKYLGTRGFKAALMRSEHGNRKDLLFQDLFKVAPRISPISALARITGLNIKLTDEELRNGFREFVEIHRAKTGELPRRRDFVDACESRMFLPRTGITVPNPLRLQKRASVKDGGGKSYGIAFSYREFFDVPGEITEDELSRLERQTKYRLEELIDNLRNVQKFMNEQNPNVPTPLTPSRVDIENYARTNRDAVPWSAYESWIYHGTDLIGGTPKEAVRSLEWLREQAGIGEERAFVRRPKNNPRGYWTKGKIENAFCEAWKSHNPRGFQPYNRKLSDPPTMSDIESMVRIQASIIAEQGELIPGYCETMNVPRVQIPSVSTIKERYPGGYQKLLADIEQRYGPDGGIRFSSGVALQRMARAHKDRNAPDRATPVRVAAAARAL